MTGRTPKVSGSTMLSTVSQNATASVQRIKRWLSATWLSATWCRRTIVRFVFVIRVIQAGLTPRQTKKLMTRMSTYSLRWVLCSVRHWSNWRAGNVTLWTLQWCRTDTFVSLIRIPEVPDILSSCMRIRLCLTWFPERRNFWTMPRKRTPRICFSTSLPWDSCVTLIFKQLLTGLKNRNRQRASCQIQFLQCLQARRFRFLHCES